MSPIGSTKCEIDYILTDKSQTFTVINSFSMRSDHWLLRASLTISTKTERVKLAKHLKKFNIIFLSDNAKIFQVLLNNKYWSNSRHKRTSHPMQ